MAKPFHQTLYTYGLWSSYFIFALTTLGLWSFGDEILTKLEFILNIYIALFLIYSFNPYNKKPVDEFGRGIAFSAGILLLLTKGIKGYLSKFKERELSSVVDVIQETTDFDISETSELLPEII